MRIKAFPYIIKNEATDYEIGHNSTVVIDAHNFFYDMYEKSRLPYLFGCESNRFAFFLKEHLGHFKKAKLQCFFIFRGDNADIKKKYEKKIRDTERDASKNVVDDFVLPIFAYKICKQVLDEMNFKYITYPLEAKDYCLTLAQKFGCPVISLDIEYAMSKVSYIPYDEMIFVEQRNTFRCLKFNLDVMLKKYKLNEEKFVLFIVLTDTTRFPEDYFIKFFCNNHFPINPYSRLTSLLQWLSGVTKEQALHNILKYLNSDDDRNKVMVMVEKTLLFLKEKQQGIPAPMFLYGDRVKIISNDLMWFEKGVFNKFIAKPYINLYYSNVYIYQKSVNSYEDKNEYVSKDIIAYAYNLLTNYTNQQFSLNYCTGETVAIVDTTTLPFSKPVYEAVKSVFENGWDNIKELRLFQHFLNGTMRGIELKYLGELPEDAQLLMISLTYYTMKSSNETLDELYSILLSYVMLGIVFEEREDINITKTDYKAARDATDKYFQLDKTEHKRIFDSKLNFPLSEFQHCLEEMNYLNALCGFPYKPTIYSKTYNGTFVYKILYALKTKNLNRDVFLVHVLELPATVYSYLQNLLLIHGRLTSSLEN